MLDLIITVLSNFVAVSICKFPYALTVQLHDSSVTQSNPTTPLMHKCSSPPRLSLRFYSIYNFRVVIVVLVYSYKVDQSCKNNLEGHCNTRTVYYVNQYTVFG